MVDVAEDESNCSGSRDFESEDEYENEEDSYPEDNPHIIPRGMHAMYHDRHSHSPSRSISRHSRSRSYEEDEPWDNPDLELLQEEEYESLSTRAIPRHLQSRHSIDSGSHMHSRHASSDTSSSRSRMIQAGLDDLDELEELNRKIDNVITGRVDSADSSDDDESAPPLGVSNSYYPSNLQHDAESLMHSGAAILTDDIPDDASYGFASVTSSVTKEYNDISCPP